MWKLNVLFNDFSNLNILFLVTPIKLTYGFPLLLDKISISFKCNIFSLFGDIAFQNASLPANLLEK